MGKGTTLYEQKELLGIYIQLLFSFVKGAAQYELRCYLYSHRELLCIYIKVLFTFVEGATPYEQKEVAMWL